MARHNNRQMSAYIILHRLNYRRIFCFTAGNIFLWFTSSFFFNQASGNIVTTYLVNSSSSYNFLSCFSCSEVILCRSLPSTVCLRLLCPTFTSARLILSLPPFLLSYSTDSSAAVSALTTMLCGEVASWEVAFLSHFLLPPLLHGNLEQVSLLAGCI